VNWALEVVVVSVSDVDCAKTFYAGKLGFAVDHYTRISAKYHIVRLTPLGSGCSNVAIESSSVRGLEFGSWYYSLRPFIQPLFVLWVLFVSGVIWQQRSESDDRLGNRPSSSPNRPQLRIKRQ
jgi:catechol 2,3-dioxygenase-like lactoylglutathione lyase family enzyme